jgi:hypothetical protein
MTFIHVAIEQVTHTCPGDPQPHVIDRHRVIVAVVDGGPCRAPITIHCGDTVATISCRRHEPAHRQCPACRITVIERTITTTHVGHHGPQQHPTTGIAA